MLFVGGVLLFAVRYCVFFIACRSMHGVCSLLLFVVCCLLFVVCCLLFVVWWLVFGVGCRVCFLFIHQS